MKAIVQDRFGPPEVLRLADTDLPEVGADDVLVRVHAGALNPADWHILRGDPLVARLMGVGLTRPKARVAGVDAAGVVEAAGANVRGLRAGDEVLGFCRGALRRVHACAAADLVVPAPAGLTFEQAAAVPIAATTALRGIRDVGEVRAGQRVLINEAGGGVGTYAVQIAAALGAEVTGVCSTRNAELVRSIGAAHVVDYTSAGLHRRADPVRRDPRQREQPSTLSAAPGADPERDPGAQRWRFARPRVRGPSLASCGRWSRATTFVPQRLRPLPARQNRAELLAVTGLIADGKLLPVVGQDLTPWPRRPRACAPWSRATRAARSSSPSREIGRRGRLRPAARPRPTGTSPPRRSTARGTAGSRRRPGGRRSPSRARPARPRPGGLSRRASSTSPDARRRPLFGTTGIGQP